MPSTALRSSVRIASRCRKLRYLSTVPAPRPEAPLSTQRIDLQVAAKIEGEESQIVTVELRKGEKLRAESASMIYMTEGVEFDTNLGEGGTFSRWMTGQNVFLTDFVYNGENKGTVALGTDFPSKIIRLSLDDLPENTLICQRGAYLASNPGVAIEMEFTKSLKAGFFGGQGFILQKLSGEGDVLVKGGGTVVVQDLKPGEILRVSSGSIVAFERTIEYDVQMMPGIKNVMFGGEGLFITSLKGPGRVWLQGMPPDRMIAEIARRVPSGGPGIGIPIGVGGGGSSTEDAGDASSGDDSAADAVAATDASIQSERLATVATSGQSGDTNSPSSLFGDAAPEDTVAKRMESDTDTFGTDDSFSTSSTEPTFSDSDFASSEYNEPTFDEVEMKDDGFANEELSSFDDETSTEGLADTVSEDSGSSVLGTLWDLFMGGRDD
ncbi:hypothetical protein FisN_24Lh095 [Fistulifera solaris]|uniref:Uncharacterized protein n=1 Tax=Fistulifera solaris TaxID=1519565 RepID=A0A1Z5K953_FISSO|nr:hypothetical protein FisN_24Lh095 [Fistulifera solaris]|eukprot:GAX22813.1 hypothetical protein FisN_24Lh095 [Fistulifera solaris]